ncbi:hypothetical protein ACS52_25790 [Bacillus cereus]|nr:hypothetical protein ACS52_25790 [Bacillus cereus]
MLRKLMKICFVMLLLLSTVSNIQIPTAMAQDRIEQVDDDLPGKMCGHPVRTVNGGFEKPLWKRGDVFFKPEEVPGWDTIPFRSLTTAEYNKEVPDALQKRYPDAKSGRLIEIQHKSLGYSDAKEGNQYAELNAAVGGVLYTKIPVPNPKKDIHISVYHKQRQKSPAETMHIVSGPGTPQIKTSGSGTSMKGEVTNAIYTSPEYRATGQWVERNVKVPAEELPDSGDIYLGFYTPRVNSSIGNFIDNVHFGTEACLDFEKKAPKQVKVGDTFNYTVTAKNVGGFPAEKISLKDVLPEEVVANGKPTAKVTSAETEKTSTVNLKFPSQNDYSQMQYEGELDIDDVIEFTIPVKAMQAGEVKNQASIMYFETAEDVYTEWEKTNIASTTIQYSNADVSIQKSVKSRDGADKVFPGHFMDYTIKVENHAIHSEAKNVRIEDLLPEGIEPAGEIKITKQPDNMEMSTQHEGKQLSYTIPSLKGNESVTVEIPVKVLPSAMQKTVSNTAKLTYEQPDNKVVTRESKAEFSVLPLNPFIKLNKAVEKVDGGDTYHIGDRVKYTITVENTIPGSIANSVNVNVFDKLPEGITVDKASIQMSMPEAKYTIDEKEGQLIFQLGQLVNEQKATITFEAVLNEKAIEKAVVNTVKAKVDLPNGGEEFEPDPSNPATVIIQSKEPKLSGEKSHIDVNGGEVKFGDTIQYTVRLKQEEIASSLKNVMIEDTLPEYLQYKEGSGKVVKLINGQEQGTSIPVLVQGNKLLAQIGDMKHVEEYAFIFETEVLRSGAGKTFINEAIVKGNKPIIEADGTVKIGDEISITIADKAALVVKPYDEPTKPIDPEDPKKPVDPIDETKPDKKPVGGTKGPLSLDFASSLNFGEHFISSKNESYFAKGQKLEDGSTKMNYVQITDNRANMSSWTLSVRQNGPLKDKQGRELTGAKITFRNAEIISSVQMPGLSLIRDSFDVTADGSGAAQNVLVGKSGEEEVTYVYRFGNDKTKESSIQLDIPGETTKYATSYETTFTWSLSDVPANE